MKFLSFSNYQEEIYKRLKLSIFLICIFVVGISINYPKAIVVGLVILVACFCSSIALITLCIGTAIKKRKAGYLVHVFSSLIILMICWGFLAGIVPGVST